MSRFVQETIFAAAFAALGLLFWANTGELIPSAAFFPKVIVSIVIILACIMVYQSYQTRIEEQAKVEEEEKGRPAFHTGRLVAFFILCLCYVGALEFLGYFIATPAFIIITYSYLRSVRLHFSILLALGFSIFIYLLFIRFLHVPIPLGMFEGAMEAWL